MDRHTVFLKETPEGRLRLTEKADKADFVRIPLSEYISIDEWNDLVEECDGLTKQLEQMQIQANTQNDEDMVLIPRSQYNGFLNLLRILKERQMSHIDKAKADQYGYTLKNADISAYDNARPELKACYVTKSTSVSLHFGFEDAYFMIIQDLKEFYNLIDLNMIVTPSYPAPSKIKAADLLFAITQRDTPDYDKEFYVNNSDYGRKIKEFLDASPKTMIFDIAKLHGNPGSGVYEISYWATGPI